MIVEYIRYVLTQHTPEELERAYGLATAHIIQGKCQIDRSQSATWSR